MYHNKQYDDTEYLVQDKIQGCPQKSSITIDHFLKIPATEKNSQIALAASANTRLFNV